MAQECRTIHFSGQVQGIGFRWTACKVAARYAITGSVRNLPDGRVEVMAQGDSPEIEAFLGELRASMGSYIRKETCQSGPVTNAFKNFAVRY